MCAGGCLRHDPARTMRPDISIHSQPCSPTINHTSDTDCKLGKLKLFTPTQTSKFPTLRATRTLITTSLLHQFCVICLQTVSNIIKVLFANMRIFKSLALCSGKWLVIRSWSINNNFVFRFKCLRSTEKNKTSSYIFPSSLSDRTNCIKKVHVCTGVAQHL